jgi:hypothetical protein
MKVERSTLLLLFRLFRPIRCQGGNAHPHTGCWLVGPWTNLRLSYLFLTDSLFEERSSICRRRDAETLHSAKIISVPFLTRQVYAQAVCIEPYSLCMCAVFICEFSSTDRRLAMLTLCRTVIFARPVLGSTPSSTGGSRASKQTIISTRSHACTNIRIERFFFSLG